MIFSLGFLVSGLLALLFLPAFSRRALRLSTRRLEMQLPLSMDEIVAERDQLRAEFALGQRRLEQRVETLSETRSRDMSELGRRATRIATLEIELADIRLEKTRVETQLATSEAEHAAARVEVGALGQAHWDVVGRLEASARALDALTNEHRALSDLADERRSTIAGLETRAAGFDAERDDLHKAHERARRELLEKNLAADKLAANLDFAHADIAGIAAKRDQLGAVARERLDRIAQLEEAHRSERRARLRAEAEAAAHARALSFAESSEAAIKAARGAGVEATRNGEKELLQQLEDSRARNAALEGALASVRREVANRRGKRSATGIAALIETPATKSSDASEATPTRRTITDIGTRVTRLVPPRDESPETDSKSEPKPAVEQDLPRRSPPAAE